MSANEDIILENSDIVFSNRSSVSSNNSSQMAGNATSTEDKSSSLSKSSELMYLEPVVKIHQFSKIKSKIKNHTTITSITNCYLFRIGEGLISSIDIFEIENFSVFVVTYTLVNLVKYTYKILKEIHFWKFEI